MLKVAIVKDRSEPMLGLHGLDAAFYGLKGTEVTALVDSKDEGVTAQMAICGAKRRYRTMEEMLACENADIAVLCSRHPADHIGQIRLAAKYGCHVFCEKPMTADLEEADEIIGIAARSEIKICVAHPGRYNASFSQVRESIASGAIGQPFSIATYGKSDHRGGGEDMMTLGTHLLDYMIRLFGAPERVMAELYSDGHPTEPDKLTDTVEPIGPSAGNEIFANFRFTGGIRGTFESRANLFKYGGGIATNMGLVVIGSEGAISARFTDSQPDYPVLLFRTRYPLGYGAQPEELKCPSLLNPYDREKIDELKELRHDIPVTTFMLEGYRLAALDLVSAIGEDRKPHSNEYNAMQTLEMIYGIYTSHIRKCVVELPLSDRKHPLISLNRPRGVN